MIVYLFSERMYQTVRIFILFNNLILFNFIILISFHYIFKLT